MKNSSVYVLLACLVSSCGSRVSAEEPLDQARHFMRDGNGPKAVEVLKPYLASHPEDLDSRVLYGQALSWTNDFSGSETEYTAVLSSQPTHRDALMGLATLRGYQNRCEEAVSTIDRALTLNPLDGELKDERAQLVKNCRNADCDQPYRFTTRLDAYHEGYSFTDSGNGLGWSLQDRYFHGWNAGVGASYEHRFKLDDMDLSMNAAHELPWRHSYAGFSFGGATRSTLLPTEHLSIFGGVPLAYGFSAESDLSYRHYTLANVYAFAPSVTWEGYAFILTGGYSVANTYYTAGGSSGALSSYSAKLGYSRWCRLKPWVAYAHSKEAFEEGLSGIHNFRADHYTAGGDLWLVKGWTLRGSFTYENRPDLVQQVRRCDVGLSYSWGNVPKKS